MANSQSYGFSSSHVQMWELDHKEGWVPKNLCFQTVVLEKMLASPLDCKEIKPVKPKGNYPRIFIGMTDAKAEAEAPILWPPDAKSQLIGKDPDAGKDWGQEKETTDGEMAGWHHRHDGREFEWAPRVGDGQRSLACCSPWGHKESDTTEQLNSNNICVKTSQVKKKKFSGYLGSLLVCLGPISAQSYHLCIISFLTF